MQKFLAEQITMTLTTKVSNKTKFAMTAQHTTEGERSRHRQHITNKMAP